jgi:SET domain-containing protein
VKSRATSASSIDKKEVGDRLDETLIKMEPLHPSKPSRSASQKAIPRAAPLFDHLEDATMEAKRSFAVLDICTYANKFLGYTEHAMECDCNEEWGKSTTCTVGRAGSMASKTNMFYLDSASKRNTACGEDSDCINRATKMECVGDCGCGSGCQNQRFQQRQYANVSVIKTEKKGYGLRTNSDLRSGDFLFEYIGEVINEPQFRRRMVQYDEEGIKHFYFMSLSKGEFVDATKKGNLGRFCNHSCSPNCYVDKWVVGDKLRMGIFAERKIKAGEELVFNYNVDRYGANPQPCYCGEPNCTGFIGGKTQTERATKLSAATIEALGIDDGDSWDTAVAKKPRKKKAGEEDEDYVESMEAKTLDTDGVTKVMAALMQCKEKWIAVKLLQRVQRCDDEQVRNRVVKMHGYQILNSQLAAWKEDVNVVLQILDILDKFPRLTRNKIVDSKIESTLHPFTTNEDERVSSQSITLLDQWSKLEVAYRIPRKKRDPNEGATPQKQESRYERRESAHERKRSRSRSQSRTPPRGPSTSSAPSGPRSSLPQRNSNYFPPRPPPFHRPVAALPRGWFQAADNGKTYYYSADGQTTWTRPTQPAAQPPPPPKQPSSQDVLKSIIDNIVSAKEKERDVKNTTPETPQPQTKDTKGKKEEKWKSYDEGKKKKLYENTVSAAWCYQ